MSAKDELNKLLNKLNENVNGTISVQGYVDILSEGLSIILPDILNQIAELDARVKELTERFYKLTDEVGKLNLTVYLPDAKPTPTLCPHCSEPMVCSNPICTGRALPDQEQPTPTDEKLIAEYLFLFNARFNLDVKDSEDVRDILRQLIAEARS